MTSYQQLFERNKKWAAEKKKKTPSFFEELVQDQNPDFLIIGCSDSRVSPETITNSRPGELFVHRNIGNLVNADDQNIQAVIEFAVMHLEVKHIIVCGHYGCAAVKVGLDKTDMKSLNPWLSTIKRLSITHHEELEKLDNTELKYRRLVEINVLQQCENINEILSSKQSAHNSVIPLVHPWVYDIHTGELLDLDSFNN